MGREFIRGEEQIAMLLVKKISKIAYIDLLDCFLGQGNSIHRVGSPGMITWSFSCLHCLALSNPTYLTALLSLLFVMQG
jgi:hypothetical protein